MDVGTSPHASVPQLLQRWQCARPMPLPGRGARHLAAVGSSWQQLAVAAAAAAAAAAAGAAAAASPHLTLAGEAIADPMATSASLSARTPPGAQQERPRTSLSLSLCACVPNAVCLHRASICVALLRCVRHLCCLVSLRAADGQLTSRRSMTAS